MARQLQLTFHGPTGQWKKKIKGIIKYFGKGSSRSDMASYRLALEKYQKFVSSQQEQKQHQHLEFLKGLAADIIARTASETDHHNCITPKDVFAHCLEYDPRDRQTPAAAQTQLPLGLAVGPAIEQFLSHKAVQSRSGILKGGGRKANLQSSLKTLQDFVGEDQPAEILGQAATLGRYYAHLLSLVDGGIIAGTTAAEKLQAAKQFIRWSWELGFCDLPRNVSSRELMIFRASKAVKPMPIPVLKQLVESATGVLKAQLLLMANCGFYQIDCAELLHSEVDFEQGTITRRRSKRIRGKDDDVPRVRYFLWPSTATALRAVASADSILVLPNRNGVPSVRSTISPDGKVARTDNFAASYRQLYKHLVKQHQERLATMTLERINALVKAREVIVLADNTATLAHFPAKAIRKTSATAIGSHPAYKFYVQYFLGHSVRTVAEKHYILPADTEFHACCEWLGQHLGLYQP